MTESFPLKWPFGRERTPKYNRKPSGFKTTPARAMEELLRQLKMLGATNIVISSNVSTYRRGGQDIMYTDQSEAKEDPGVAIYYSWSSDQYVLACDKWNSVTDNLQALMKTIDAIRGIERWGSGEMMRTAFAGFKAIPEKIKVETWCEILGVPPGASEAQIKDAYRKKAMQHHPDRGGSSSMFHKIQTAYSQGLAQLK